MSTTQIHSQAATSLDYYAAPGLSQSGMKDLAISPFRYWHKHVNPNRAPDEPTAPMIFGSALHCAVLEPEAFHDRYACEFSAADHLNILTTMDDLRAWLRDRDTPPKGKLKQDLVKQVQSIDPEAPIFDILSQAHFDEHIGKTFLSRSEWVRVHAAAESLLEEPRLRELISAGQAEVEMSVNDPETGVLLKAKMDFLTPRVTLDLKTFSQQRGRSIDKSVATAIINEKYHIQGYFYGLIRAIEAGDTKPSGAQNAPEHVVAFVESEEPYEVRLRSILPRTCGEVNLLWEQARIETRRLIRVYDECQKHFGDRPWRYAQDITPIEDSEIPGLAF